MISNRIVVRWIVLWSFLDPQFTCSGWFQIDGGVLLESLSEL